jgi:lysosomal alpha-mannosidase
MDQRLQLVWRGTPSLGTTVDMFTDVMYQGYGPLPGFCFDQACDDPPIRDDPRLEGYNVGERAALLAAELNERAVSYQVNELMFPFGSDFQWENADTNLKNMDKLMKHMNANTELYGAYACVCVCVCFVCLFVWVCGFASY